MLNSLIRYLFPILKGIERIETNMVTKEQFDAAQSAYFAKVAALIAKINAHPAAADFTDELNALNEAAKLLPADDAATDSAQTASA